jgi:putative oxidoreductase
MDITNGDTFMTYSAIAFLVGRGLLAALFILAGLSKIVGPKPVLAHMAQERVPKILLPLVIVLEMGCGTALLLGWYASFAAAILSAFCIATAIVFHRNFAERAARTQFFKDVALAGALAVIATL